uniref:NADH-ubiquinone oxidoreductase chain 2 n=1 Tax=Orthotomicus laricis TaxID=102854 RepID=A0A2D0VPF0_9CUCU|nr:NADH dehydrogenase subunit 2 [Orthotomicus laricis]AOY40189.1 NADH dehydrogenase subunit 2 [Orthotomicus laricis]
MLFSFTLISGTLITISSTSWFTAWMGLEINLLSMMPLMKNFNNKYSAEATLKYFMTQALASAVMIFSILLFSNLKSNLFEVSNMSAPLLNLALLMKMGAAPLHFWLPEIVSGISWNLNFIILTWQKIGPSILLFYTFFSSMYMSIFIILSTLMGSLNGINQTCLRKLLVFSSINHIGWLLMNLNCSLNSWLIYFIIYSFINMNIIFLLNLNKIYFTNQINKMSPNKTMKFFFMMNFLSLGGLPPFIGFFIKWITINEAIINKLYSVTILMILFTLLALFFYTRLTFSSLTLSMSENLFFYLNKPNFFSALITFLNLSSLILCFSINSII